jgi:pilus assembly protein CpaC
MVIARRVSLIFVLAITGGTTILWAQKPALQATAVAAAASPVESEPAPLHVLVGRSTIVDVPGAVTRVSLTSAEVADVMMTSSNQILVNGKLPGTISMFVWDRGGALRRYEVIVQRDLVKLNDQIKNFFPGERIEVQSNGKNIVLAGMVSNKDVVDRAVNVAAGYVDKREDVVSLLQIQGGAPSNQVLLRVRFAEVSRSALTQLGASYFTGPNGYNNQYIARAGTEQFGNDQPVFDNSGTQGKITFSDFLNLFLFDTKNQLGAVLKVLQSRGQFQSLAEPNLVAESGKEASFLAGGEFPVPIAQGSGANLAISVVFKEFGIRLTFTPTVIGNRVHLKVRPEVSTLDFGNGVTLNGFKVPALSTRRTETELELDDKQTFAIAGLMNNTVSSTLQKIPGIGDIPILGLLFKSKAAQKDQTELVVMITPEILPLNSKGVTPSLPRTPEPFLPALSDNKSLAAPPAPFGASPSGASARTGPLTAPVASIEKPSPAAAAATVSGLSPAGPQVNPTKPPGKQAKEDAKKKQ